MNLWKNRQGMLLQGYHWPAPSAPRAAVALVHGMGEHAGRYTHLAERFNRSGLAVTALDLRGHGNSPGNRGHAKDMDVLLDDVDTLIEQTRALYPAAPVFLYGHSMGGNLALNYFLFRQHRLSGLLTTGPWIRLAFQPPAIKLAVGNFIRHILPALSLSTNLSTKDLSRDPAVVAAYERDPLVHDRMSAAMSAALFGGASRLEHYAGPMVLPVLIQHGGADAITSASASEAFAAGLTGDVTYRKWEGLYHEIHNEPEKEEFFSFTLAWLERHLP